MRFRLRSLFLVTALVAVGLTAGVALYRWQPLDGYGGTVMAAVWGNNTVWAPGYTDAGFRAVRIGMKRSEVYALLGKPLGTYPTSGGGVTEYWTQMGPDTDCSVYHRHVTFQGDVVVTKLAEFSPD
jgi:hypothetical protein